jgi:hypothetical protein
MSVFAHCIKEMLQLRPEQVWIVQCAVTRNTTAPVSMHRPHTREFSWAPDGLRSDVVTDRVMVNIDTSVLITNSNLNDFQIKTYSVFNTISEWFILNSLSLNLNKTFHGIKVFRIHKYIIRIMISCKKKRETCGHLFRKLKLFPLTSQYILSFLLLLIKNWNQFTITSEIHNINSRQLSNFHQPVSNLS